MLGLRVIAAIVGVPLLLLSFYYGNLILLIAVIALITLALGEYTRLINRTGHTILIVPLLLNGFVIPILNREQDIITAKYVLFFLALLTLLNFVLKFPRYKPADLALTFLGILYIVAGFSHILLIRSMANGFWLLTYIFLIIWSTDTGAYFTGMLLGRHKLASQLSPNKTWEGFIGGLVLSVLVVFLLFRFVELPDSAQLLYIVPLISIVAQLGDLFESALKRFAGIKDTGNIIPGHGGILDRFDSALWAIPTAYYLVLFLERMF
jgi:phosphatidate cytidylyltransferase